MKVIYGLVVGIKGLIIGRALENIGRDTQRELRRMRAEDDATEFQPFWSAMDAKWHVWSNRYAGIDFYPCFGAYETREACWAAIEAVNGPNPRRAALDREFAEEAAKGHKQAIEHLKRDPEFLERLARRGCLREDIRADPELADILARRGFSLDDKPQP